MDPDRNRECIFPFPNYDDSVRNLLGDRKVGVGIFDDKGIEIINSENPITEKADILFCGSKIGAIDHETAETLSFSVIVPTAALPITTRAVAVCKRRNIIALPDFITTAGPLINDRNQITETLSSIIEEVINHAEGPLIGACERAEVFLSNWQSELPFGRPMAS